MKGFVLLRTGALTAGLSIAAVSPFEAGTLAADGNKSRDIERLNDAATVFSPQELRFNSCRKDSGRLNRYSPNEH